MNGYSSHTFRWINSNNEAFYVKWHFKTDVGVKNFSAPEADKMKSIDADFATAELFNHIKNNGSTTWTFCAQIMPEADAANYKWNVLDITKVWPHKDYPLIPVGKMVLNKNPENYFAETEQSAFSPGHVVPGIEPSADKMLQGRLFSYPDTHRHRLGGNYDQIPINCPYRTRVTNSIRDGFMVVNGNQGSAANYEPSSFKPLQFSPHAALSTLPVRGLAARYKPAHPNCDFSQPGELYRKVMCD